MNILQLLFFTSLSVFFCNRVWGQCWQGRTFSESVVSPELRSSSILRLPDVPTLARCAKACCELQGCDLAWFFQQRCYVLSCQNTENCKPKQRPGMDSILVFLERESQQRLVLQSLVRGESFPNPKLRQPLPRHRGNENPMKDLALLEGIQNLDNSLETYQNSEDRRAGDRASGAVEQDLMYDWPANQGKEDFNQSETEKVNDPLTTIPAPPESSTFPQSYLSEMSNESKTYEKKPNATASLTTNMMDEEDSQKILSITPIHDISQASSTEPTSVSAVRDLFVSPGNIEEMQEVITEEPVRVLTVSIKGPVEVTLPQNTIELTASINPNDSKEFTPTYEWIRVTSPDGQNGLIEGQNNQSVRLAKLSAGFYVIRVIIKAQRAYGESSLNITIHPAVNISKPPKAVTVPKTQEVLFQEASICFINGSQSVGDAGIFSYLWEKVDGPFWKADGPIDTDVLQLKNLSLGEYTFKLTVWDSDGQNDSSTASVIVSNPKDDPPQARAGTDRVITLPLNQLILWGNESSDDHGITHYLWTLHPTSPSHKVTMKEVTSPSLKLSDLQEGRYLFQLTVTDSRGQQDSDTISVTVLPARILPLVAHASGSHTLMLPNNSLVLRGSVSNSGPANVSFLWVRDEQSPAAGEVLYGSDHEASLYLTNLIEGTYLFQLHVTDVQGHSSTAIATVEVQPDPREREEVELELQVGVAQVSQRQKDTVVRQLAALLHVLDSDIALKPLHGQSDISTVFRFSVLGPDGMIPGPKLARLLRNLLLREKTDFLLFRVLRVDIVMCLLLCSGHGQCDPITKSCSCDPLWMENPIQRLLFDGESNCDWSVLYVTICSFLTIVFLLSLGWMFISCCKSEKRTKLRKKTRYTILDNMDEQERMELQPKYNIKHRSTEHNSSLMMSESELESEQDNIFSNQRSSEKTHNRMRNVDNFSLCPVES